MRLVQDAVARGDYKTSIGVTHGMDAFGMYGMAKDRTAIINSNFQTVDHTDPWQHSRATLDAHKAVPLIVDFLQKHMPGFKDAFLIATASDLGIRRTRVLDGEYTLTDDDIIQGVRFPDAIAMAPYRHHYGERLAFLPHAADIPYRIMVPKGVDGLLVCSGKSASTKPGGLVRAQARCLQIGEAAGTAAALATQQGIELRALDMPTLQRKLLSQGVYLGDAELLRQRGLS